jgi:hypothetical protein
VLFGEGWVMEFALADPGWLVASVAVCPGEPTTQAQARLEAEVVDAMELVDDLAVLVVPVDGVPGDDIADAMDAIELVALDADGTPTVSSHTGPVDEDLTVEALAADAIPTTPGLGCGGER